MTDMEKVDDFAHMVNGSTLVIQRWLPGPAERIWCYLTDGELRSKWLAAGDMELAPDGACELIWRNDTLSREDDLRPEGFPEEQRMQSRVIEARPVHFLKIAWGSGDVTFELKEKGDRVLLTLTHTGLTGPEPLEYITGGWHMHLDILVAVVSGAEPPSFWTGWQKLRDEYVRRLG